MKAFRELASFQGQAGRGEYWLVVIGGWLALGVVFLVTLMLIVPLGAIASVLFLALLPILFAIYATSARRLHERGKSAWWLVLFALVPWILSAFAEITRLSGDPEAAAGGIVLFSLPSVILYLWGTVEMGILPKKKGPNKYAAVEAARVAEAFS
jgi:uncharacterized membrane protein YhaH (DUF805 family)